MQLWQQAHSLQVSRLTIEPNFIFLHICIALTKIKVISMPFFPSSEQTWNQNILETSLFYSAIKNKSLHTIVVSVLVLLVWIMTNYTSSPGAVDIFWDCFWRVLTTCSYYSSILFIHHKMQTQKCGSNQRYQFKQQMNSTVQTIKWSKTQKSKMHWKKKKH